VILLDTHAAVWLASDDPALGPVCFHCGAMKRYVGKLKGKSTCIGLYRCYACRKPFTVKMGTTAFAVLLEGLQAFTPDRSADLYAALYTAGAVLATALLAELFIRARRGLKISTETRPRLPGRLLRAGRWRLLKSYGVKRATILRDTNRDGR
jgi:hypothetical protein